MLFVCLACPGYERGIDRDGLGMFLRLVLVWMSLVVGLRSVASRVLDERLWGICFGEWVVMIPYLTYRYLGCWRRNCLKESGWLDHWDEIASGFGVFSFSITKYTPLPRCSG